MDVSRWSILEMLGTFVQAALDLTNVAYVNWKENHFSTLQNKVMPQRHPQRLRQQTQY